VGRAQRARTTPAPGEADPPFARETRGVIAARRQFDIGWVNLPEPAGRRPVLVLSRSSSLAYLTRVLVVEVTTTIRGIPQEVPLGRREGLPRSCVANLDAIRSVPRDRLGERIGRLEARRHFEVKRALGHVLGWPELTSIGDGSR
jgi:mRNA interferase MazF